MDRRVKRTNSMKTETFNPVGTDIVNCLYLNAVYIYFARDF